jgi:glycosyltransferase involved in cell wall biosynthesis
MKILHLSTWKERCGIATYTEQLVDSLNQLGISNDVYPVDRMKLSYFSLPEIKDHYRIFCERAQAFDLIHIQHEHGFFHGSYPFNVSVKIFSLILTNLKKTRKPVFVTFHTEPAYLVLENEKSVQASTGPTGTELRVFDLQNAGLKSKIVLKAKKYVAQAQWQMSIAKFFREGSQFQAIVHSRKSRLQLIKSGFSESSIQIITHAFPERNREFESQDAQLVKKKLGFAAESIVLSIFGFVSGYKGYEVAIQSLRHLPDNFVLAIIGGPHPEAAESEKALDDVFRAIELAGVGESAIAERVIITGYVDTDQLKEFHLATDICLAPYLPSNISASGALTWALTSGKPVIASNIPAFKELNQAANCLVLFQPTAHRELAWHIERVSHNDHIQKELVNNAAAYVQSHSWGETTKKLQILYSSAIDAS